jgi:hypothetical protein
MSDPITEAAAMLAAHPNPMVAASMTGVGLLYPNDRAISKAVSPLTRA